MLHLPRPLGRKQRHSLGRTVAAWKEHALADHNESLTFVLSPKLLHAYVELQAVFHRDRGEGSTLCTWRHTNGELCTKKRRWSVFCRQHWRHADTTTGAALPSASLADIASASQPGAGDAPAASTPGSQAAPPAKPKNVFIDNVETNFCKT